MMEVGWSARRVARQLSRSACVVRRCWDQWIREMSFSRKPSSGRPRQTSHREDLHIVRNARVQPTASSAAILAPVPPPLGAPMSSRNMRRCLAEGYLGYHCLQYTVTPSIDLWHDNSPDHILQPHVLPCMQRLLKALFQQDNAWPHTGRVSQDCLCTVTTLTRPAQSPDVSPIEPIWDHLGRRVGHPMSLDELEARLQQIWNEMSQDIIQNLYA
ncbi:UNVERIFIED_CONTAM: hypothetical protein NCL1_45080 [Trichonephila clavipes]